MSAIQQIPFFPQLPKTEFNHLKNQFKEQIFLDPDQTKLVFSKIYKPFVFQGAPFTLPNLIANFKKKAGIKFSVLLTGSTVLQANDKTPQNRDLDLVILLEGDTSKGTLFLDAVRETVGVDVRTAVWGTFKDYIFDQDGLFLTIPSAGQDIDIRIDWTNRPICVTSADSPYIDITDFLENPEAALAFSSSGAYHIKRSLELLKQNRFETDLNQISFVTQGLRSYAKTITSGKYPLDLVAEIHFVHQWKTESLEIFFSKIEKYLNRHYAKNLGGNLAYLSNLRAILISERFHDIEKFDQYSSALLNRLFPDCDFSFLRALAFWSRCPEAKSVEGTYRYAVACGQNFLLVQPPLEELQQWVDEGEAVFQEKVKKMEKYLKELYREGLKNQDMPRRCPEFESGKAVAETAKLKKFSDAGGTQSLWLSDAGRADSSIMSGIDIPSQHLFYWLQERVKAFSIFQLKKPLLWIDLLLRTNNTELIKQQLSVPHLPKFSPEELREFNRLLGDKISFFDPEWVDELIARKFLSPQAAWKIAMRVPCSLEERLLFSVSCTQRAGTQLAEIGEYWVQQFSDRRIGPVELENLLKEHVFTSANLHSLVQSDRTKEECAPLVSCILASCLKKQKTEDFLSYFQSAIVREIPFPNALPLLKGILGHIEEPHEERYIDLIVALSDRAENFPQILELLEKLPAQVFNREKASFRLWKIIVKNCSLQGAQVIQLPHEMRRALLSTLLSPKEDRAAYFDQIFEIGRNYPPQQRKEIVSEVIEMVKRLGKHHLFDGMDSKGEYVSLLAHFSHDVLSTRSLFKKMLSPVYQSVKEEIFADLLPLIQPQYVDEEFLHSVFSVKTLGQLPQMAEWTKKLLKTKNEKAIKEQLETLPQGPLPADELAMFEEALKQGLPFFSPELLELLMQRKLLTPQGGWEIAARVSAPPQTMLLFSRTCNQIAGEPLPQIQKYWSEKLNSGKLEFEVLEKLLSMRIATPQQVWNHAARHLNNHDHLLHLSQCCLSAANMPMDGIESFWSQKCKELTHHLPFLRKLQALTPTTPAFQIPLMDAIKSALAKKDQYLPFLEMRKGYTPCPEPFILLVAQLGIENEKFSQTIDFVLEHKAHFSLSFFFNDLLDKLPDPKTKAAENKRDAIVAFAFTLIPGCPNIYEGFEYLTKDCLNALSGSLKEQRVFLFKDQLTRIREGHFDLRSLHRLLILIQNRSFLIKMPEIGVIYSAALRKIKELSSPAAALQYLKELAPVVPAAFLLSEVLSFLEDLVTENPDLLKEPQAAQVWRYGFAQLINTPHEKVNPTLFKKQILTCFRIYLKLQTANTHMNIMNIEHGIQMTLKMLLFDLEKGKGMVFMLLDPSYYQSLHDKQALELWQRILQIKFWKFDDLGMLLHTYVLLSSTAKAPAGDILVELQDKIIGALGRFPASKESLLAAHSRFLDFYKTSAQHPQFTYEKRSASTPLKDFWEDTLYLHAKILEFYCRLTSVEQKENVAPVIEFFFEAANHAPSLDPTRVSQILDCFLENVICESNLYLNSAIERFISNVCPEMTGFYKNSFELKKQILQNASAFRSEVATQLFPLPRERES